MAKLKTRHKRNKTKPKNNNFEIGEISFEDAMTEMFEGSLGGSYDFGNGVQGEFVADSEDKSTKNIKI